MLGGFFVCLFWGFCGLSFVWGFLGVFFCASSISHLHISVAGWKHKLLIINFSPFYSYAWRLTIWSSAAQCNEGVSQSSFWEMAVERPGSEWAFCPLSAQRMWVKKLILDLYITFKCNLGFCFCYRTNPALSFLWWNLLPSMGFATWKKTLEKDSTGTRANCCPSHF